MRIKRRKGLWKDMENQMRKCKKIHLLLLGLAVITVGSNVPKLYAADEGYITAQSTTVLEDCNHTDEVIQSILQDTEVEVIGKETSADGTNWYHVITLEGNEGYIKAKDMSVEHIGDIPNSVTVMTTVNSEQETIVDAEETENTTIEDTQTPLSSGLEQEDNKQDKKDVVFMDNAASQNFHAKASYQDIEHKDSIPQIPKAADYSSITMNNHNKEDRLATTKKGLSFDFSIIMLVGITIMWGIFLNKIYKKIRK